MTIAEDGVVLLELCCAMSCLILRCWAYWIVSDNCSCDANLWVVCHGLCDPPFEGGVQGAASRRSNPLCVPTLLSEVLPYSVCFH